MNGTPETETTYKPRKQVTGPNQIIVVEDNSYTTTDPEGCVKLRMPEEQADSCSRETFPPRSVPGVFRQTVLHYAHADALARKVNNVWQKINFAEYYHQVKVCAKAFLALGLRRHYSVAIIGHNSIEWFVSYLGAIFAGGIAVGLSRSSSCESTRDRIVHCRADIVVVGDSEFLRKIEKVRDELPDVKAIVLCEGQPTDYDEIVTWEALMAMGERLTELALDNVMKTIAINECCVIVYTPGTTGEPKGVMLSHDNLTWSSWSTSVKFKAFKGGKRYMSHLPLSDIPGQMFDIHGSLLGAICVYMAPKNCEKDGKLMKTIKEVKPVRFLALPKSWENGCRLLKLKIAEKPSLVRKLLKYASDLATKHHTKVIMGDHHHRSAGFKYKLARALIFSRFKKKLGMDKCITFGTCSAPLCKDVKRFFLSIDVPLVDIYGMCECTGAQIMCSVPYAYGVETIGTTLMGMATEVREPNIAGEGEMYLYGRNIFMGYLNDQETTEAAVDEESWFRTGDLARMDRRRLFYLRGRIKELIVSLDGVSVSPAPIEELILKELPHMSHAVVVGNDRPCLTVLLTLKTVTDLALPKPRDILTEETKQWMRAMGCEAASVSQVLALGPHKRLMNAINRALVVVNKNFSARTTMVRGFTILPASFSVETGEMTPAMKLKRHVVMEKYADLIDVMYESLKNS